uniref:serine hydrolase domain-containing protein n=1 Tax=Sphingomonas sp. TaxID=28214 RepID=UPI003B3B596B
MVSMKWLGALAGLFGMAAVAQQPVTPPTPLTPAPVLTQSGPAMPATARALTAGDVETWLDGYMPYALRSGDIAGAVVTVVKDGQVIAAKGYGYADVAKRRRVDPARTLFRPGSVSKLVTWTAVMQQVEAGRLDLDAD